MIRFSMEIPTSMLEKWTPWTDLDFVLANKVLEDREYADFFARRRRRRECILDNSMHELGYPLPVSDLVKAARRCRADYVVAPDRLGEPEQNLLWFQETVKAFRHEDTRIGVVLAGRTREERKRYLLGVAEAAMILLPYRENRLLWYLEHSYLLNIFPRIHLLGVNELSELQLFAAASVGHTSSWSVDTAKAVKWGLENQTLAALTSLRGGRISSKDLLNLTDVSPAQEARIYENVGQLLQICRA